MKKLYKVKKSNIHQRGLCAADDIKKGSKIIEYKGRIIPIKETETNQNLITKKLFIFSILINGMIWMEILNIILLD